MAYPRNIGLRSFGARWMLVGSDGTTEVFPDDGFGGVTTNEASADTINAAGAIVEGYILIVTGADLRITNGGGTAVITITDPGAGLDGTFQAFGIDGAQLDNTSATAPPTGAPFGASISTGTTARYLVFYRSLSSK